MRSKQKGVFMIEMSFVMFFLAALLFFTGDIAYKLFNRVNLDRVSYSLVNIVKERTRFYDGRLELIESDVSELHTLAKRLLNGHSQFGLRVESLINEQPQGYDQSEGDSISCKKTDSLSKRGNLAPENLKNEKFPLYQVTLCYKVNNWFDRFFGKNKDTYLHSTSVIVGR